MGIYNKTKEKFDPSDYFQKVNGLEFDNSFDNDNKIFHYIEYVPDAPSYGLSINTQLNGLENNEYEYSQLHQTEIIPDLPFVTNTIEALENVPYVLNSNNLKFSINDMLGWIDEGNLAPKSLYFSFWVKKDNQNANGGNTGHSIGGIVRYVKDGSNNYLTSSQQSNPILSFYFNTTGQIGLRLTTPFIEGAINMPVTIGTETNVFEAESSTILNDNEWYYVTFKIRFENSDPSLRETEWINNTKLFINGVQDNISTDVVLRSDNIWFPSNISLDTQNYWLNNDCSLVWGNQSLTWGERAEDLDDPAFEALYTGEGFNGAIANVLIQSSTKYSDLDYANLLYMANLRGVNKLHSGIHNASPRLELSDKIFYKNAISPDYDILNLNNYNGFTEKQINDGNRYQPNGNYIKSNTSIQYLNLDPADTLLNNWYDTNKSKFFDEDLFDYTINNQPTKEDFYFETNVKSSLPYKDDYHQQSDNITISIPIENTSELQLGINTDNIQSPWPLFVQGNVESYPNGNGIFDYDLITSLQLDFEVSGVQYDPNSIDPLPIGSTAFEFFAAVFITAVCKAIENPSQLPILNYGMFLLEEEAKFYLENLNESVWSNDLRTFLHTASPYDAASNFTYITYNYVGGGSIEIVDGAMAFFTLLTNNNFIRNEEIRHFQNKINSENIIRFYLDLPYLFISPGNFDTRNDKISVVNNFVNDINAELGLMGLTSNIINNTGNTVSPSVKKLAWNSFDKIWENKHFWVEGFTLTKDIISSGIKHQYSAYYNFVQKRWDYISNGYQLEGNTNLYNNGDLIFGPSTGLQIDGTKNIESQIDSLARPINISSFPVANQFEATEEQQLDLKNYVPDGFILTGYSLDIPIKVKYKTDSDLEGNINIEEHFALTITDGKDFTINGFDIADGLLKTNIFTSFLLKQSDNTETHIVEYPNKERFIKKGAFSFVDKETITTGSMSITSKNRELISYGQTSLYDTHPLVSAKFASRYTDYQAGAEKEFKFETGFGASGLYREQNIEVDATTDWFNGIEFRHNIQSNIKITPSNQGSSVFQSSYYRLPETAASGSVNFSEETDDSWVSDIYFPSWGGGTNPFDLIDGRAQPSIAASDLAEVDQVVIPSMHQFANKETTIPDLQLNSNIAIDNETDGEYTLFNSDKIVLGVQAGLNRLIEAVHEQWDTIIGNANVTSKIHGQIETYLLEGKGTLKLHGKFERNGNKKIPNFVSSPSNDVAFQFGDKIIGDQYQLEAQSEYAGGMSDRIIMDYPTTSKYAKLIYFGGEDLQTGFTVNRANMAPTTINLARNYAMDVYDGTNNLYECTGSLSYRIINPYYNYLQNDYANLGMPIEVQGKLIDISFIAIAESWADSTFGTGSIGVGDFIFEKDAGWESIDNFTELDLINDQKIFYVYRFRLQGFGNNFSSGFEQFIKQDLYKLFNKLNSFDALPCNYILNNDAWELTFGPESYEFIKLLSEWATLSLISGWIYPSDSNNAILITDRSNWKFDFAYNVNWGAIGGIYKYVTPRADYSDYKFHNYHTQNRSVDKIVMAEVSAGSAGSLATIQKYFKINGNYFYLDSLPVNINNISDQSTSILNLTDTISNSKYIYENENLIYLDNLSNELQTYVNYDSNNTILNNNPNVIVDISKDYSQIDNESLVINNSLDLEFPASNFKNRTAYQLIYGLGSTINRKHIITDNPSPYQVYIASTNAFETAYTSLVTSPIRGFRFGKSHLIPAKANYIFSSTHFGHFRDMLEQGLDSNFFNNPELDSVVKVNQVNTVGDKNKKAFSLRSNQSSYARLSKPYHDMVETTDENNNVLISSGTTTINISDINVNTTFEASPFGKSEMNVSIPEKRKENDKLTVDVLSSIKKRAITKPGNTRQVILKKK